MTPVGPATFTDALLLLVFVTLVLHLYHSHLSHLTPYLFQIFNTTFKMEDQRGIITRYIISLIISMIITEEHGKTIDIIIYRRKAI